MQFNRKKRQCLRKKQALRITLDGVCPIILLQGLRIFILNQLSAIV
jgi:hypothetical protein